MRRQPWPRDLMYQWPSEALFRWKPPELGPVSASHPPGERFSLLGPKYNLKESANSENSAGNGCWGLSTMLPWPILLKLNFGRGSRTRDLRKFYLDPSVDSQLCLCWSDLILSFMLKPFLGHPCQTSSPAASSRAPCDTPFSTLTPVMGPYSLHPELFPPSLDIFPHGMLLSGSFHTPVLRNILN